MIVQVPGCLVALREMGWVEDEADEDCLVIPPGKFMSMAEVRKVEDAKERLKKEQAEEFKERLRKESQRTAQPQSASAPSSAQQPADAANNAVEVQA